MGKLNVLLREMPKELPRCAIASAKGLELKPDGIHFNSRSYRVLGKRYFEKYKELAL